MIELSGAQSRQLIDCEQVFTAWRAADRTYRRRFRGAMVWKAVGGRRYLYCKRAAIWRSLGPESDGTRLAYERFHDGRDALKSRRAALEAEIGAMAPVNRAMRLGRVPLMSARVLRRLDRTGVLGHGFRIAGTHAMYAYERMGGVHFGSGILATQDVDLLYDARGGLDLVGSGLDDAGMLGLLQALDATFAPTEPGSFRAANATGFLVDLIMPLARRPASASRSGPPGDLRPVEIVGLGWLESSPATAQVAIDERGFPLMLVAPDPRAFACHKTWLSRRDDRDPLKRRRDRAQALIVAAMLASHRPDLRFDDTRLSAIPHALIAEAAADAKTGLGSAGWEDQP